MLYNFVATPSPLFTLIFSIISFFAGQQGPLAPPTPALPSAPSRTSGPDAIDGSKFPKLDGRGDSISNPTGTCRCNVNSFQVVIEEFRACQELRENETLAHTEVSRSLSISWCKTKIEAFNEVERLDSISWVQISAHAITPVATWP